MSSENPRTDADGPHELRDLELLSVSLVPAEDVEGYPGGVVQEVER